MEQTHVIKRPKYIIWMHTAGLLLAITAFFFGGFTNPSLGFALVISLFIALDLKGSADRQKGSIHICYGDIMKGGIRRGLFSREMVALAMLYSAISNLSQNNIKPGTFSLILATALMLSSAANELELFFARQEK
jgi:hypothetical protein